MAETEIVPAKAGWETIGITLADAITKLRNFLRDEKGDMEIVKDDVESLNTKLELMQAFLRNAENKPESRNSNLFITWVSDVSEIANECNDVADKISPLVLEQPKMSQTGCLSLSCCISYNNTDNRRTRELSVQIKKLLSDCQDISSRRIRYDPISDTGNSSVTKIVDGNLKEQRTRAPYANNQHMVGQHETIKHLTDKLMNKDSDEFVISIVGTGGLGKTTLARILFNTLSEEYFTSRAWVRVSKQHNTKDILMSLINSMTTPSNEDRKVLTTINSMEAYLEKSLSNRRFLLVFDDVWDQKAWESLERTFPNNNNGSKIIITTRNEQVAESNNAYVQRLWYLDEDESWELFCKKVLPLGKECPSNLEEIGKEMVANCSGLPLAIEVLGGMLFTKSLAPSEWEAVRDNIWKELKKNSVLINKSDLHHNDKLRGKNKNKLSDIDSISSGGSIYDLNADINSAISAMGSLGIKLGEVLPKLSNFFRDKEDDLDIEADVVTLEDELKLLQKGLEDAEIKPDKDISLLKTWVKDVSKLAIEGEPVVDQITSLTQEETKTDLTESIRILSTQIMELLVRSKDLSTMRTRYDTKQDVGNTSVGKSEDETFMEVSRSASFDNNEQMIIHLDTINDLSTKLMNGDSGQFFIAIVGRAGLGKTTIASTLFSTLSSQHFTYSAWVSVSKEYNIRDVLMLLINSLTAPSQEDRRVFASINLMIPHLRKYLSDHRCLVAIDDVRDLEIWEILQRVYPKNNNGSKVIITTRNETMVVASNNVYVHKLRCLDEDESWALFCRKALSQGTKCPSNLEQVGKQMVAQCSGVPLNIEALGDSLLKKPLTLFEWEAVRDKFLKELENDELRGPNKKLLSDIDGGSSKDVEVLELVLPRLSHKELVSLLCVSSRLNQALSSYTTLWHTINLREMRNGGERLICALSLPRYQHVRYISLDSAQDIEDRHLEILREKHSLKLENLESLNLNGCHKISDKGIEAVSSICPNLKVFSIDRNVRVSDISIMYLAANSRHIIDLNLSRCKGLSDSSMMMISDSYPDLESLNITRCAQVTDDGLHSILGQCHELQALNLYALSSLTDEAYKRIALLTHLKFLDLCGAQNLTDEGLSHIAKCKKMTSLNLTLCTRITDEGVLAIAHGCPGLAFLSLFDIPGITDKCLEALSKSCASSLTTLDVNGCTGIKRRTCDDLLKLFPMLTCFKVHS